MTPRTLTHIAMAINSPNGTDSYRQTVWLELPSSEREYLVEQAWAASEAHRNGIFEEFVVEAGGLPLFPTMPND